jgi:tRNA A37 threonylcarbamoyladenosine dehydratase
VTDPRFQRLALLAGQAALDAFAAARVTVFGAGGVGSWCAEALARSGVGAITLVDSDLVCVTNINRQVQATGRTVGQPKVEALRARLADIAPACAVDARERVFERQGTLAETAAAFGIAPSVYVIDAIDSLGPKLDLIETAALAGAPLYSCMGMAQKMDPTRIQVASIWETTGCPLARLVRQGLRKRGFKGDFDAVFSTERLPLHGEAAALCGSGRCFCPPEARHEWCSSKKVINGSAVTVTAAAGMVLASLVLRDLCRGAAGGAHG